MAVRSRSTASVHGVQARLYYFGGFLRQVQQLLWMGYQLMGPVRRFANWKEEELSEKLANAMQEAIERPGAPAWAHRYAIYCERPVSHVKHGGKQRRGKQRPRIDIEFERTMPGRHPRFQFEAKRLRGKTIKAASAYLGEDGLGCFISATYASEWDQAGMLGYIQTSDASEWASRIEHKVRENRKLLHLTADGDWVLHPIIGELPSYRTCHERPTLKRAIAIYHTLLIFH